MQPVNLLPSAHLHARQRRRRVRGWTVVTALVGITAAAALGRSATGGAGLAAVRAEQARVQSEVVELQRRQALAVAARSALIAQAKTVATPATNFGIPAILAHLAAHAPPHVFLTRIGMATPAVSADAPLRQPAGSPAASAALGAAAEPSAPRRIFEIEGLAPDHDELNAFTRIVEQAPGFGAINLVRSQRVEREDGAWHAFRLECRWEDGQ